MILRLTCAAPILGGLLLLSSLTWASRCPGRDWIYRKGTNKCYFIYSRETPPSNGPVTGTLDFPSALEECRIRGGRIATLDNAEELEWLKAKLNTTGWLWLGLTYERSKWEWYDGENYQTYTDIAGLRIPPFSTWDKPPDYTKRRMSLYLNYEHITDLSLESNTSNNGYICKGDWSGKPWCNVEGGWRYHDGRCTRYYPELTSFTLASRKCGGSNRGHIVTPTTEKEDVLYQKWLKDSMKVSNGWMGIEVQKTAATQLSDIRWQDGTAIDATNISHWSKNVSLSNLIAGLPSGRHCGTLQPGKSEWVSGGGSDWDYWGGSSGSYVVTPSLWNLTNDCLARKPYACEAAISTCPYGWQDSGGVCYQFNLATDRQRNWTDARSDCQRQGADLAVINNEGQQTYIVDYLSDSPTVSWALYRRYWIGLTGLNSNFQWINESQPLTMSSFQWWANNTPPANSRNETCVYLNDEFSSTGDGEWKPTLCSQKNGYICQALPAAILLPVDPIIPDHTCEAPFFKYHDGCYVQVRQKLNRDGAQNYCKNINATLAHIDNAGENSWFKNRTSEDTWIGIRITGKSFDGKKWQYSYSDGTRVASDAFKNFKDQYTVETTSNLNNASFERFCGVLAGADSKFNITDYIYSNNTAKRGDWFHWACTIQLEFYCYHHGVPIKHEPQDTVVDPLCGAGWRRHEDKCYQLHTDRVSWRLAKQVCRNSHANSDLLTITTRSQFDHFQALLDDNLGEWDYYYWNGDDNRPDNFWLGLYAESDNAFYWNVGNSPNKWHIPLVLSNWATGQPRSNTTGPRCVDFQRDYSDNPRWYSTDCYSSHAFICERSLPPVLPPVTPAPTPASGQVLGCTRPYVEFHERCVKFELETTDWLSARKTCRDDGGDLMTFRNQAEIDRAMFGINAWIGLNSIADYDKPRIFVWSNGHPLTFTPWDTESSSSTVIGSTDVNCGALTSKGFSMYACAQKKTYICEKPLQSVDPNSNTPAQPTAFGCQTGGFGYKSSCYFFGTRPNSADRESVTFQEADNFCRSYYSGRLATINDADEQTFITSHVSRFQSEFWVGLKKSADTWTAFTAWITGDLVTYTNWAPEQPGSVQGDGCVALKSAHNEDEMPGDWFLDRCTERKYALCETPRNPAPPTRPPVSTTPRPTGCPSGWKTKTTLNACYKGYMAGDSYSTTPILGLSWRAAENFCRGFKTGHLVSIASKEEQDFMTSDVQTDFAYGYQYWIGLSQSTFSNQYSWSDYSPVTITNYDPSEDHSSPGTTSCVAMDDSYYGYWIKQNCAQSRGWICELSKGAYLEGAPVENFPTVAPMNDTCGESSSNGAWYYDAKLGDCMYFSKLKNTWQGAQEDCHNMDAHLITVRDSAHHDWITMKTSQLAASNNNKYWIGLYQTSAASTQFAWDHGESLYRAWESGEPDPLGIERCVLQNSQSGRWKDNNCGDANMYICEKSDRVRPSEEPTRAPDIGNCPSGWTQFYRHCYNFVDQNRTWEDAHKFCNQLPLAQSELISIGSQMENDFILTQMKNRPSMSEFWTGLREMGNTYNDFGWSDNSPLRYKNWHFEEPLYFPGLSCVTFLSNKTGSGKWLGVQCDKQRPFVCKAAKDPSAPAQPAQSNKCSPGYSELDGNCFIAIALDENQQTWDDAQRACRNRGDRNVDLATITDAYEQALLHVLIGEHWARGNNTYHAWINMKEHYGHFAWDNTCPVVFSNLLDLSQQPTTSSCVAMGLDGKWRVADCQTKARYALCQRRFTQCPATFAQSEYDYCPINFGTECNRACYRIDVPMAHHPNNDVYSPYLTYASAKKECEKLGGKLASVKTEDDQECLKKHIDIASAPMWFGLYKTVNDGRQVWQWIAVEGEDDIQGSSFLNWADNQPTNGSSFSPKDCGEIQPTGKWTTGECAGWDDRGFICEAPKIRRSSPRRTTLPPGYGGPGLSSGQTAGVVIGVLILVAITGAAAFVHKTGRTQQVVLSVRSMGDRFRSTVASKMSNVAFSSSSYNKHNDKAPIQEDPEFGGDSYS